MRFSSAMEQEGAEEEVVAVVVDALVLMRCVKV
jgi:hypothetical protein